MTPASPTLFPIGLDIAAPIDLTLTLRPDMRGVTWDQANTVEQDGWNARTLHLYSHAGTHMDAQTHFAAGPGTIDVTPLTRCMGWAWVVPLDGIADKTLLTPAHLGDIASHFQPGDSLLLRTGWSRHIDHPQHYRDHFPRISEDLAHWCVENRVNILGVEPPSIADVNNKVELTRIHHILLSAGITIVEGLANLQALTTPLVFFIAVPLKIESGDGSPCRAFAWTWSGGLQTARKGDIPVARKHDLPTARKGDIPVARPIPQTKTPATPTSPLTYLNPARVTAHRNHLPHWQQSHATYFVTFRMADCLPESLLKPWRMERDTWLAAHPKPWTEEEEQEYLERFTMRIEHWLDEGHGSCHLRHPACAEIVASTLRHFDGQRHHLHAFVIMPNHVHVLFSLIDPWKIQKLIQSWKSHSAQRLNQHLGLKGAFWMKDYFDRSIRDADHFDRVARYIERNPVKARLRPGQFLIGKGGLQTAGKGDIPVALKDNLPAGKGDIPVAQSPASSQGGPDAAPLP